MDFMAATIRGEIYDAATGSDAWPELLAERGLIKGGEAELLRRARTLYYLIEHAAAHHGLRYPPLPERVRFFERYLDALLGELSPGGDPFLDRLAGVKRSVREIFDRFCERLERRV